MPGRWLWEIRASKQLLVYINILNKPLVKHWGYRTNYSAVLLPTSMALHVPF